ncbi:MAG: carbohydrate-binding family 9-like protein [Pyrinomonadaceae bacterium]
MNELRAEIEVPWTAGVRVGDLRDPEWERANPVAITRYWSGEPAPPRRHAEARILWSNEALCVRFTCRQGEPLVVSPNPQTQKKTIGLWDRDVCEIYLAPDPNRPERYFELEAAPTGEWLDLAIHHQAELRETDWKFESGMTAAARAEEDSVVIVIRIPWSDSIKKPENGERWRANLFRCVGAGENRGYLAWQPTRTAGPNFHVPQAFGWLFFI